MLRRWSWLIALMIALVALWGCSDDGDDNPVDPGPSKTAFEVMAEAGKAYINDNKECPGVIGADAVDANRDDYTIIDIRKPEHFAESRIAGAYNSSLATLLTDLETTIPKGKPYVIACYSGQSAGHAKIAMELMGYTDVYSMKFGMSAWSGELDKWTAACGENLPAAETTNNNPNLTENDFPTLIGSAKTIVETRVTWMLAQGFKAKSWESIRDNTGDYFILNYFGESDYLGTNTESGVPGHIPGAFQFTPYASLGDDEMLKNLPTNKQIIVYCWTGQHSSQVTAYLNMLGYDAYSLAYGSNHLFYDDLKTHKWGQSFDFPLEKPTQ